MNEQTTKPETRIEQLTVVPRYEDICNAAHCFGTTIRMLMDMQPGETLDCYPIDTMHIEVTCHAPSSPQFYTSTGLWNSYTINGTPVGNQCGLMFYVSQMMMNSTVTILCDGDRPARRSVVTQRAEMTSVEVPVRNSR